MSNTYPILAAAGLSLSLTSTGCGDGGGSLIDKENFGLVSYQYDGQVTYLPYVDEIGYNGAYLVVKPNGVWAYGSYYCSKRFGWANDGIHDCGIGSTYQGIWTREKSTYLLRLGGALLLSCEVVDQLLNCVATNEDGPPLVFTFTPAET